MSKICSVCKKEKDIDEFHKRKTSKDGYRNTCKACVKNWQADKKDTYDQQRKVYRENHREENRKISKDWYSNNKEKRLKTNQEWRKANPEAAKEINKRSNANRPAEKVKQNNLDRRARVKNLSNTMPENWWSLMLDFYGAKCAQCGSEENLTHDHIIPASWPNSSHSLFNSQILCNSHNASKNGHRDTDYRDWSQGILLDDLTVIYDKMNE